VNAVIISTKQHEVPKNNGQRELDLPQLMRASRLERRILSGICSEGDGVTWPPLIN
jgi:hypothetical protein